jgi:heme oxygenase
MVSSTVDENVDENEYVVVGGTPSLTQRMRERTNDMHETSDKLVNFKLAMVLTSKPLYAEAVSLFWPIYRELETLMERHKDHPQLKLLYPLLPTLRRAKLFEKDMTSLLQSQEKADLLKDRRIHRGDNGEEFSPPELQAYIDHLRQLSDEDPSLLIPYIYSMYGAIMAGGSIIKRMVKVAFSLKTNDGVQMLVMSMEGSGYKNIAEFRKDMKQQLDEKMNLTKDQEERILCEGPEVFKRNNALVATVKDTKVFLNLWQSYQYYAAFVLSAAFAVFVATKAYRN